MRILQVNKFLYRKAGTEAFMFNLADLLVSACQEVGFWGMGGKVEVDPQKFQIWPDLLVSEKFFNQREGFLKDLSKVGRMIWSFEAAKKFEKVLDQFHPDIIHLHNIYHHLSPSILSVAYKYQIPVVQTLHDFKLICPNYKLFTQGAICERCYKFKYWQAIRFRCVNNSFSASCAVFLEMSFHHLFQIYERNVDYFLTPSNFLKNLLIKWGKDEKKIIVFPHFLPQEFYLNESLTSSGLGDFILFAGRLTEEKGIWLLFEIAKKLPEIKFKIAGSGPDFDRLSQEVTKAHLSNFELLGFCSKEELQKLLRQARLVIVPSLWYENYPMAVLEAMASKKTVLATASGGIPEIIKDGYSGFLIEMNEARNVNLWVDKIKNLYHNQKLLEKTGEIAAAQIKQNNAPDKYCQKILEFYNSLL